MSYDRERAIDNYKRWQKLSTIRWQKMAAVTAVVSPFAVLRRAG